MNDDLLLPAHSVDPHDSVRLPWQTPELVDLSVSNTESGLPVTQEDVGGTPTTPIFYAPRRGGS